LLVFPKAKTVNKLYSKHFLALALGIFFSFSLLQAQDIHYSQFGNSPLNVSPALTGAFDGDTRFGVNFRSQWSNVPAGFTQFTGFTDMKFIRKKLEDKPLTPWAGGLMFDYDRAGDSKMNLLQLGASGSYTLGIGQRSGLIIGGMLSGIQRAFDTSVLRFGDQYNGKDPITGTEELFPTQSKLYASIDAGLTYRFRASEKRTSVNVGVGGFHLNRPKHNFFDEAKEKLPRRWSIFAITTWQLTNALDLTLNANHQFQGVHTETVLSAGLPIHLSSARTKELAIEPGIKWRIDDAIIPFVLIHYRQWQGGLSYDINISAFTAATMNRAGPELSLICIFKRPREAPFCPPGPTYL
jgi:type IX secretion system PorP/SprF family membrane protein